MRALTHDSEQVDDWTAERARVERALENLRKQHLSGDLTDDEYRAERQSLQRQLKPSNLRQGASTCSSVLVEPASPDGEGPLQERSGPIGLRLRAKGPA